MTLRSSEAEVVRGEAGGPRLLLCTYEFPPLLGARGARLSHLTRELVRRGWRVDVLTASHAASLPRYDPSSVRDVPDGVGVYRTFPGPLYTVTARRVHWQGALFHENHVERGLSVGIRAVLRALTLLAVPDGAVQWLPSALYRGWRLLRCNRYDVILSAAAGPFSAHVLGYFLKRLSRLPWIVEYGDPWVFNPCSRLPGWRHAIDELLERTLLRSTDAVVVTNERIRTAYLQHFPFLRPDRTEVVMSGYAGDAYEEVVPITSDRFRVIYTGVFYRDIRSPEPFFAALERITDLDVEVVIAGSTGSEWRDRISRAGLQHVRFLGQVPHAHAIGLQKGASLLLLIGNDAPLQLPLKTFEYIGARRPILCLRNGRNDLAAELLEPLRRGIVVDNKPDCIAAAIRAAYDLSRAGRLEERFDLTGLDEYTWVHSGEKLYTMLSAISADTI